MKEVYAYVRVSTVRQGEKGSSLQEQRDSIATYAQRHNLRIAAWFEEMETAAKVGRREFARMLGLLTKGKATGIVLHKIDRGARNLKDWANLRQLTEQGIDVHLAHDSFDLSSRSGALAADIQAVIAVDYIRNLRDEVRKGIYGRLKQGIYPFGAPLGYLNRGGGVPKEPDPERAPLVCKAFDLYATASFSLRSLQEELHRLGLRNRSGGKVSKNRLAEILSDPFYIGIIQIKRNGQVFPGVHRPLISKILFDRVQAVLHAKTNTRTDKHAFMFRRLVRCLACRRVLTGEHQKGFIYYRCHTSTCRSVCIREDVFYEHIRDAFAMATLNDEEFTTLQSEVQALKTQWTAYQETSRQSLGLNLDYLSGRLSRLTDAFLDGAIDRQAYDERNRSLLMERASLEERISKIAGTEAAFPDRLSELFEQSRGLSLSYERAIPEERRDLVSKLTSNLSADGKKVVVELRSPYREIANRDELATCGPLRDRLRTNALYLKTLTEKIHQHLIDEFQKSADDTSYRIGMDKEFDEWLFGKNL